MIEFITWRKSSRSSASGNCVEVAQNLPGTALLRDSKLGTDSPVLAVSPGHFAAFLDALKNDRLDG
ncbi:DUF397 domain-containing protein [Actinopolyspora erythraea]|uniref:DUF397 domain-containing protein n=1 Tax=Actinopolyspora erythraea TaxID=414996 RepID=A0A099D106_9ACTN|nr:DUF397 domain-containing protein [Actinopolyspora erythraea]ASU79767.1 DUF397 domain-containing protein [Actinopolyspora erythraea]KGI79611.1 hypothetical protein IL38_22545 [Actinopolyspora erythraea]